MWVLTLRPRGSFRSNEVPWEDRWGKRRDAAWHVVGVGKEKKECSLSVGNRIRSRLEVLPYWHIF